VVAVRGTTSASPGAPRRHHRRRKPWATRLLLSVALVLSAGAVATRDGWGEDEAVVAEPTPAGPVDASRASETPGPDAAFAGAGAPSPPAREREVRTRSARMEDVERSSATRPTRLRVDTLGIDAAVDGVAVRSSGEMDVPRSTDSVGWYRLGPGPGDPGSAVLAAHVTFDGADGPFRRLGRIKVGSEILVQVSDGSARRFRVVSSRSYAKGALPTAEIFATDGTPRLALVTCGGEYDARRGGYPENVVVYAVPA
jgi:hypothetical protein